MQWLYPAIKSALSDTVHLAIAGNTLTLCGVELHYVIVPNPSVIIIGANGEPTADVEICQRCLRSARSRVRKHTAAQLHVHTRKENHNV